AFVGPRARHLRLMGDKVRARRFMARAGVPVLRGSERALEDGADPGEHAAAVGYPLVVKAVAGGGGRGLRVVERAADLALAGARALRYHGLGTMEFLLGPDGRFEFIEMNPRLQVEHTVTEAVTGVDLVMESFRIAAGLPLAVEDGRAAGHAIQWRIYAEPP